MPAATTLNYKNSVVIRASVLGCWWSNQTIAKEPSRNALDKLDEMLTNRMAQAAAIKLIGRELNIELQSQICKQVFWIFPP